MFGVRQDHRGTVLQDVNIRYRRFGYCRVREKYLQGLPGRPGGCCYIQRRCGIRQSRGRHRLLPAAPGRIDSALQRVLLRNRKRQGLKMRSG